MTRCCGTLLLGGLLMLLVATVPAFAGPASQHCTPTGGLMRPGEKPAGKTPCRTGAHPSATSGATTAGQRRTGEVPLPGKLPPASEEDDSLELSDGVSLTGRLGPRDQPVAGGVDNVAPKRTAIVPRATEESPGNVFKHGASDGLSLGLSFDFETK